MARLPLVLSAHHSPSIADGSQVERERRAGQGSSCQACGLTTGDWQGSVKMLGQAPDFCPLCVLPQNLNRAEIDQEAILIWLPEMAQPVLNSLVRTIHLFRMEAGLSPRFDDCDAVAMPRSAVAAVMAYRTLYDRSSPAEMRLGTASPRQLGVALLSMTAADYGRRGEMMGGLRLLSLGRFFHAGRDVYPAMLGSWTQDGQASP